MNINEVARRLINDNTLMHPLLKPFLQLKELTDDQVADADYLAKFIMSLNIPKPEKQIVTKVAPVRVNPFASIKPEIK